MLDRADKGFWDEQERFKQDFVTSKPTMLEFIERLRSWRDRYETVLKRTANLGQLANSSHWLVEFQYQKFDEIEMFGQYHQVSFELSLVRPRHRLD